MPGAVSDGVPDTVSDDLSKDEELIVQSSGDDDIAQPRWVLHLDMDSFFASVEQLTRPTLQGRPILVGGSGRRGVVAGASYEARAFGAHSAMPMHQARKLIGSSCVVIAPRGAVYRVASKRVFDIVRRFVPVVEQLSGDEAFIEPPELSGARPSRVVEWAESLRAVIKQETGLVASVGAGAGKQFAKIGSGLAKPDGVYVIPRGQQHQLLDDMPVRKLWGIGSVADEKLARLEVRTIGQFAAMTQRDVVTTLGRSIGPALQDMARGIDTRPVQERASAKQVSAESTYENNIIDMLGLQKAVDDNGAHAHHRLLKDGRGARTVTVKLRLADMSIVSRSATLLYATVDLRTLLATAHSILLDPRDIGPIRLVGVSFSGLSAAQQASLFPDIDRQVRLSETREVAVNDSADQINHESHRDRSDEVHNPHNLSGRDNVHNSHKPDDQDNVQDPHNWEQTSKLTREAKDGHIPVVLSRSSGHQETSSADNDATAQAVEHWRPGDDVKHSQWGHGWVQGSGHGKVSVRFETRSSGPGRMRTFRTDDDNLERADPLDSLDWEK